MEKVVGQIEESIFLKEEKLKEIEDLLLDRVIGVWILSRNTDFIIKIERQLKCIKLQTLIKNQFLFNFYFHNLLEKIFPSLI